jgi:energy-coupling factor transport system permease protein
MLFKLCAVGKAGRGHAVRNLLLGQYVHRGSVIHSLDPRTKLIGVLALTSAVMAVRTPMGLASFALLWLAAVRLSRVGLALAFRNLRAFLWLLALTFLAQVMFSDGQILWTLPFLGLRVTAQGLENGIVYSLRLALLIGFATMLTLTTSPIELADALESLLKPLQRVRVPVRDLVMMISLSLSFIPILLEEAERIRMAQLSRGARFTGSLGTRARALVPLVVPLFLSAFRRAEELALAMEARCYHSGAVRTSYQQLRFGIRDLWAAIAVVLVSAVSFASGRIAIAWP